MNENGIVLPQQTLCSLNVGEINRDTEEHNHQYFYANIKLKQVSLYISSQRPY